MKANETVMQNLRDAGCEEKLICAFASSGETNDHEAQRRLLNEYRKRLLDSIHTAHDELKRLEKELCCLDYLLYQMRGCECSKQKK